MPEFTYTPTPVPLNPLMSAADFTAQQQKLQANALAIQGQQLQNQYTSAIQPAQINMLLQGMQGMSAPPTSAPASSPQDAPPAQPSGWQAPQGGTSLFTGDTPVSADAGTQQLVGKIAAASGVNPDWAMRVHYAESGASPQPFGQGSTSSAGAIGPMQLMPETAKGLGADPTNLQQNIQGGVNFLGQLKAKYGNPVLATAAFNAGPARVDAFLSGKGSLPGETLNFVGKVFGGDGVKLMEDAMSGDHGPVNGVPLEDHGPMQATPVSAQGGDQETPSPNDAAARAAVLRLMAQERFYMALPNGTGVRAAAQTRASLDNIAGPGGIPDPATGNILRVPGSFATRYAASQAAKAGESVPAAALYAQNEGVRAGTEAQIAQQRGAVDVQTHAANAGTDVAADTRKPIKVSPGEVLTTPASVGVGTGAPAPGQAGATPGSFQAPANPAAVQTQVYKEDREAVQPIIQQGQDAQQAQIRTRAMRDSFAANPSGAGADAKVNLVNWTQGLFGDGAATDVAKKLTGVNSVADAQEAAKLALVNAGTQERGALGARGSLGAIKLYQSANPNIALQPDAIKKISNMQLVAQQADADFAEGAAQHVLLNGQKLTNNQGYDPLLSYDHQWQSSRPSQVYAAAMSALNGDAFDKWSKNLSPDEGKRVVGILTRADPGAAIQWKGGATFHVPSN